MERSTVSLPDLRDLTAAPLQALWRALALIAALGVLAVVIVLSLSGSSSPSRQSAGSAVLAQQSSGGLAETALGPVSAALGAANPAYSVHAGPRGLIARSSPQHLHATFTRMGLSVRSGGLAFGMRLRAVETAGRTRPVGEVTPAASANRVWFSRAGVTEWYANGPLGLEQGFTLSAPARDSARASAAVSLVMAISHNARPELQADGRALTLHGPGGSSIRYGGLQVSDAGGRVLSGRLQLRGAELRVQIDARGARYPLRVDPLVQQGRKIPGQMPGVHELFGYSVALSGDGGTALIGARHGNGAWVFVREGVGWKLQAALITTVEEAEVTPACEAEPVEAECGFGRAVALSSDGNTALIGAAAADEHRGAAWVFTRTGSTWAQQGEKLTAAAESARGHFGTAVALSGDGSTAVIGGSADSSHRGSAWVFARSGSEWGETVKLVGTGTGEASYFGRSVAISRDGSTVMVGGPGQNHSAGAVWAYALSEGTWVPRGLPLSGAGESGEGRFGFSVALSDDGSTALVGGRADEGGAGAAWVFARQIGSGYVAQGGKLTGGQEEGPGQLGYSAALSANGSTALVGGPRDGESVGAAWVYTRTGSVWSQQGSKRTGADTSGKAWFGASTALAADGLTAVIGGFHDNGGVGAAWVFQDTSGPPVEEEEKEPPVEEKEKETTTTPPGKPPANTTTVLGSSSVLGETFVSLPAPTLGVSGNLRPIQGKVRVKLPGSKKWILVTGLRQVPFGTIIDARHGKFSLTTAKPGGGTQTVTLYEGEVKIGQSHNGRVTLLLFGGNFSVCPTARERSHVAHTSARRRSRKHTVRKLWAEGHGSYSTKGNYASGAVLGTRWLTIDRCDGTLIRVLTDKVSVYDIVKKRHHTVKAGHSYLAKAP